MDPTGARRAVNDPLQRLPQLALSSFEDQYASAIPRMPMLEDMCDLMRDAHPDAAPTEGGWKQWTGTS